MMPHASVRVAVLCLLLSLYLLVFWRLDASETLPLVHDKHDDKPELEVRSLSQDSRVEINRYINGFLDNDFTSNHTHSHHGRSVQGRAPAQTYAEAVAKGNAVLGQFAQTCDQESQFQDQAGLQWYGWVQQHRQDQAYLSQTLDAAAIKLGVDPNKPGPEVAWLAGKPWTQTLEDGTTKTNRPSRGNYKAIYNVEKGVIFRLYSYSPENEGADLIPPVRGDELPLLNKWSDVAFLTWVSECRLQAEASGTDVTVLQRGLKAVVINTIVNKPTIARLREILIDIAKERKISPDDLNTKWPGFTFYPDQDHFKALIGSPSGIGVAYFALQHQQALGKKHIASITYYTVLGNHLIFEYADDPTPATGPSDPAPRKVGEPVNATSSGATNSTGAMCIALWHTPSDVSDPAKLTFNANDNIKIRSNSDKIVKRAPAQTLEQAVAKGQQLFDLMTNLCTNRPSPYLEDGALNQFGWEMTQYETKPRSFREVFPGLVEFALAKQIDPDHPGIRSQYVHSNHWDDNVDGTVIQRPPTQAQYLNLFNKDKGVIFALRNYGCDEEGKKQRPPVTPDQFPRLRQWSDFTFLTWDQICGKDTAARKNLNTVLRNGVQNQNTLQVVKWILDCLGLEKTFGFPGIPFYNTPHADGGLAQHQAFLALLQTPNVLGVAWMLIQRRQQLGFKIISQIDLVYPNEGLFLPSLIIVIHIVDAPSVQTRRRSVRSDEDLDFQQGSYPLNTTNVTSLSRRADYPISLFVRDPPDPDGGKSYGDSTLYGQSLICQMDNSDPPTQSVLLDFTELERNGWYQQSTEVQNFNDDPGMVPAMMLLGLTPDADTETIQEQWTQGNAWLDAEGRENPPSVGYYTNDYNVHHGIIVADEIYAPSFEGPEQKPPVTKFPTLAFWSDVSFLIWQQRCSDANRPVGSIRAVLHHDIVNEPTERIMLQALKTVYNEKLTVWPGRVFNKLAHPEAFAALLGSPNGRGTAWMLGQHRDQFGWKTVTDIRLWTYVAKNIEGNNENFDNMLLMIDNFRPPITPAPDGEHTYEQDRDYGKFLMCKLGSLYETQSTFIIGGQLTLYGWRPHSPPNPYDTIPPGVTSVLNFFGGADYAMTETRLEHISAYKIDGQAFEGTGAWYQWALYSKLGVIVVGNGVNPKTAAQQQTPPMNAPPPQVLQYWSDLTFLSWVGRCQADRVPPKNLKAILYSFLINTETNRVISDVLHAVGTRAPTAFPGNTFNLYENPDEFHALIGTPIGRGTAWMLAQHQRGLNSLGRKTITSIQIFCDYCGVPKQRTYLLINIEDI